MYENRTTSSMIGRRDGDGIIPHLDASILTDFDRMRELVRTGTKMERRKLIAYLGSMYNNKQLAEWLKISPSYVSQCKSRYPDIVEAAQLSRLHAISGMSQKKVLELLHSMDVSKIPDSKKAQSVRHLVDADTMINERIKPRERENEDVMELVLRVKKYAKKPEPIDITAEVHDERKEIEEAATVEGVESADSE